MWTLISFILGSVLTYFLMNKKDRMDLKQNLLKEAKEEIDQIDKLLCQDDQSETNFARYTYLLQLICLKILDGITSRNILIYIYLPFIKNIVDSKQLQSNHEAYKIQYNENDYLYINKVYDMFNLKKTKIKLPFYWRFKIFLNNI